MAENIVESIIVKLGLDGSQYNREADKAIKQNNSLNKSVGETDKVVSKVTGVVAKWFSVLAIGTGVLKMIDQVQKLNDELFFLEKNLGMSAQSVKAWQGAAGAMGGSAQGMTESIKSLNMGMNDFVVMGDTSLLPFMNALGVGMTDAQGKLRKTDDVMLDLADSFSKMDREQAFSIASKMGIDEGTFNTLVQGRKEMEKMLEYQNKMYRSSEEELKASRALAQNRALLGQHWESLKTMMANAIIPLFVKLSEVALGIFEYLQENQQAVQAVFKGIAFVVGALLIPILIKATLAALAFIAPFAPFILVVGALGAAFGLLYDDYKTWAEGGKSLFDWGAFSDLIDGAKLSTNNLRTAFKNLATEIAQNLFPTLAGYGEILKKLKDGDFGGAAGLAWDMMKNAGNRVVDFVADATGQKSEDLKGFIGESVHKLVNGGKTYEEVNTPTSPAISAPAGGGSMHGNTLNLSEQDIIDIMKVTATEVVPSLKGENFDKQAAGVVDTILNRTASGSYGKGVRGVANQRWAFSDINAPRKGAYGSVQNVPMSRVSPRVEAFVRDYLAKRAQGLPSSVGQNLSYANPNYLGEASDSTKKWVAEVEKQANATGQRFGSGKAIHVHGTPSADRSKMPAPFNVGLSGMGGMSPQQSMRQSDVIDLSRANANQGIASKANEIQVNVGKVDINTSSSTMSGVGQDMASGVQDQFFQFQPSFK